MNQLAGETSPYLRQHADNPVDWFAWGESAFAAARDRDRPILLSVGYSACHWCHVMAHESFEDPATAAVMNELFVCVKVDREERPDVDSVYMDAVQALTGRGGWPMTVFLMPDGRPFFGGTYYRPEVFVDLMRRIDEAWKGRRDDLAEQATELTASIAAMSAVEPTAERPGLDAMNASLESLSARYDATWGGFGSAPKFPSTMSLDLILRAWSLSGSDDALAVVTTTLDAMCSGGMYDHLGGGFARYSTDDRWLIPHFEKMLYDQALLLRAYTHGWQATGNARWRQVVAETVGYLLRDLRSEAGGFFSAEDADSPDGEGGTREGLFQTFTPAEIGDILGDDAASFCEWFGITDEGNFEGRSLPNRLRHRGQLTRSPEIEAARVAVFEARESRPRPALDDKVITEWNALAITALAEAGSAMGEPDWVIAAVGAAEFLLSTLHVATPDGAAAWRRTWQRDSGARHGALAADLAALLEAFIALAEATGEARWVTHAMATADELLARFWDDEHGGLFTTPHDGEHLVARQKDLMDNATPSANSMAANGLVRLSALTGKRHYAARADVIMRLTGRLVAQAPSAFSHLLAAVDLAAGLTEIAVAGDRPDMVKAVQALYRPRSVLAWGERYDSPIWHGRRDGFAYVCRDYTCRSPVDMVGALIDQL